MKRTKVRSLCEGAILVALAQILGYLALYRFPWGGTICLSMLPIILYACRWGVGPGLLAGFALGILQYFGDNGIAISWVSMVGDYMVAFLAVGLAGIFRGRKWSIYAAAVTGSLARYAVHYVVGATVWAEYMPETFFGMTMTTPWFYSLLYNGAYMLPCMVLCLVVFALLAKPMGKYLTGADLN